MVTALVIGAVVLVLAIVTISIYNRLVLLSNRLKNAFAQIDVQLKRRYDLIPNLVEAVKGYMEHEKQTLEAVIKARSQADSARAGASAVDASAVMTLALAERAVQGSLMRLFARVEAYPQLKASENVGQLMEELSSTENRVAFARQAYNDAVMSFNTAIGTFPNLLLAGPMGFAAGQLFEVTDEQERQVVKVSLDGGGNPPAGQQP